MSEPLSQVDPFTQAFRKLWALLESEPLFQKLVPRGNRIKYDGDDRSPDKDRMSSADWPQVRIIAAGGETDLVASSTHSTIRQIFQIQMASGDQRFTVIFLPLKWACLKALSKTKNSPANFGLAFVHDVTVASVNDFENDIEGRAQGMWAGMIDVDVEMAFNTATQLQAA